MEQEIWKDVIGYEGWYQVSSLGNVRSLPRMVRGRFNNSMRKPGKTLGIHPNSKGYATVSLGHGRGNSKSIKLHRLVLTHFKSNPHNYPEINHIDGNKLNNRVENLEWCNRKQNIAHAVKNELMYTRRGSECSRKLTEAQAQFIKDNRGIIPKRELMERFNIKYATVTSIQCGYSWKHLKRMGFSEDRLVPVKMRSETN